MAASSSKHRHQNSPFCNAVQVDGVVLNLLLDVLDLVDLHPDDDDHYIGDDAETNLIMLSKSSTEVSQRR